MLSLAVFKVFPHRRNAAQVSYDLGNDLDDVVNFLHGVVLADGKSE